MQKLFTIYTISGQWSIIIIIIGVGVGVNFGVCLVVFGCLSLYVSNNVWQLMCCLFACSCACMSTHLCLSIYLCINILSKTTQLWLFFQSSHPGSVVDSGFSPAKSYFGLTFDARSSLVFSPVLSSFISIRTLIWICKHVNKSVNICTDNNCCLV